MIDAAHSEPATGAATYSRRPSAWMILLAHVRWYVMMGLVLAVVVVGGRSVLLENRGLLVGAWFTAMLLRLAWSVLDWWMRRYTLTGTCIRAEWGVLRRSLAELPLANVQYLAMDRSLAQRVVNVGAIAGGTSGAVLGEVVWGWVDDPAAVLALVRQRVDAAGGGRPLRAGSAIARKRERVLVAGLVGGIGSGKSTAARMMADEGCVVVDSDAEARAILLREDVKRELSSWWGAGVIGEDGQIDRREVARIVFADARERARLEALVHPEIKRVRDAVIARVESGGGGIVVVDAPLLFEAGVDRECDVVVFVDAPLEQRAARVRSRGWVEGELALREAAQMPLDEKRRRSGVVIANDGGQDALRDAVHRLVEGWRSELGDRSGHKPSVQRGL